MRMSDESGVRMISAWAALLLLAAAASLGSPGTAAAMQVGHARDVGRSEPLRRVLLDALRPAAERDLGQKLIFVVHVLHVQGDWAFAGVAPRTPAGAPIDFRRTRHVERMREGLFDGDTIYALLRRKGGRWRVVAYVIGPTDVAWAGWHEQFGAPGACSACPTDRASGENQTMNPQKIILPSVIARRAAPWRSSRSVWIAAPLRGSQ